MTPPAIATSQTEILQKEYFVNMNHMSSKMEQHCGGFFLDILSCSFGPSKTTTHKITAHNFKF